MAKSLADVVATRVFNKIDRDGKTLIEIKRDVAKALSQAPKIERHSSSVKAGGRK